MKKLLCLVMLLTASVSLLSDGLMAQSGSGYISPWTFVKQKDGGGGTGENDNLSFNQLPNYAGGLKHFEEDDQHRQYGYGYEINVGADQHKDFSFSIYKLDWTVQPYTKLTRNFEFTVCTATTSWRTLASLYSFETLYDAENTVVQTDLDHHPDSPGPTKSGKLVCSVWNDTPDWRMVKGNLQLEYDNLNSDKPVTLTNYILLAFTNDRNTASNGFAWTGFKVTNQTQETTYRLNGSGTTGDPFLIGSADELEVFRTYVNKNKCATFCARLTSDIDMAERPWTPIGIYTDDYTRNVLYRGTFDGDGHVIRNLTGDSNVNHDMAFIGRSGDGCVVRNVMFENVNLKGLYRASSVIGLADGTATLENCGSIGESLSIYGQRGVETAGIGGLVGYDYQKKVSLKGCYTTFECLCQNGVKSAERSYVDKDVARDKSSGRLCYNLNGNNVTYRWLQTLGTDTYPVLRGSRKVFKTGIVYHNGDLPMSGSGTTDDPFMIACASDLKYFSSLVARGFSSVCGMLSEDIDYTAYHTSNDMIGTNDCPFGGTFNGDGHILTIAFTATGDEPVALFGYVRSARIFNMEVLGSVSGTRFLSGLVHRTSGNTQVSHVISRVEIRSTHTGDAGLAGFVAEGNDTLSISHCGFTGKFSAHNAHSHGGFIAWLNAGRVSMSHCFFGPDSVDIDGNNSCSLIRYTPTDNIVLADTSELYYTRKMGVDNIGKFISDKRVASGELCFLLNDASNQSSTWLQTIGVDKYPTLWRAKRVYGKGETFINEVMPLPGEGTLADPLLIGSPNDLETFRDFVNAGHPTACAKLTADIDMKDRNWIPIGRYARISDSPEVYECKMPYQGTFDGNGFTIYNLSGHSDIDHDMGLIGRSGDGCVVRDLIMYDVKLDGKHRCAPVVGLTSGSTLVENCGILGLIKLSHFGPYALGLGGIACCESGLTLRNSYTVYPYNGIAYFPDSASVSNVSHAVDSVRACTGQLCYELNGGTGTNHVWLQTLGKDTYPLLRRGKKVAKNNDGTYRNIDFTDADDTPYSGEISSNDFRIYHHGGNLYEFVITLGEKDGQGVHAYPDIDLSYKKEGQWVTFAHLKDINRDKLPFSEDWSGEISFDDSLGLFINAHTFQVQTPVFWITQGNHSSSKAASFLWLASYNEDLPKLFLAETVGTSPIMYRANLAEPTVAPSGALSVSVTEPMLNIEGEIAGSTLVSLATVSEAYSLGIWDATANCFISTQEIPEGANTAYVTLPQMDRTHEVVALMYVRQSTFVGTELDSTYVTYAVPFSVSPFHGICDTRIVYGDNNVKTLSWAISYPDDSDLVADDNFVISRAYKSDYSDAEDIDAVTFTDFTTESAGTIRKGWYSFTDTSKEGMSSPVTTNDTVCAFEDWKLSDSAAKILKAYKYPARYVYYKAQRAMAASVWPDDSTFTARWRILLNNVLPKLNRIKVNKTDNWKDTHKVNVRLTLDNPYPENLVDSSDYNSVFEERKRQRFFNRMFAWDENANIIVERFCKENMGKASDYAYERIVVKGSDVKATEDSCGWYVDVPDIQSFPNTRYHYRAWIDTSKSEYPKCFDSDSVIISSDKDAEDCIDSKYIAINNFKATLGDHAGKVKLTWETDDSPNSTLDITKELYRIGYKTEDATPINQQPATITSIGKNEATDNHSFAGQVYRYTIRKTTKVGDQEYSQTASAYGYSNYNSGSISGNVCMPDGTAFPGRVKVSVRLERPTRLLIDNVLTPDSTIVLMPGYSSDSTIIEVETNDTGYYEVKNLCYYGEGVTYSVQPSCAGATFVNSSGSSSQMSLTFTDSSRNYSDVDFVCRDTHEFSGRILYAGSTVPVRDMEFTVNGYRLLDTDGEPVVTDAMGNFSFLVPKFEVEVQAKRQGHVLSGGGYILGGDKGDQVRFIPEKDYSGLQLSDSTTVRLVGRVAGGETEGGKELGFGLSENILGDSITLVLQLEGDNASYLYFDPLNPDSKSKDVVFCQDVYRQSEVVMHRDSTEVSFQSKRIVVKADNETGEFCLDLYPTKYKVTQISAMGYNSLYGNGEGIHILDLTDSLTNNCHDNGSYQVAYAAGFNKIYHAPARLTLRQADGGSAIDYYGEKTMELHLASGDDVVDVAWEKDGKTYYSFGYPVFKGKKEYEFIAEAVEEYHYNNTKAGYLTKVPLAGHPVTIINGLDSKSPKLTGTLNGGGRLDVPVTPSNTTFNLTGENALMTLTASVDVNGYSYESEPLKAYVTGERDMGVEVKAAVECTPQILDYIRDPYGATSYAYRESGTEYNWTAHYENNYKETFSGSASFGIAFISDFGVGSTIGNEWDFDIFNVSVSSVSRNQITQEDGEYSVKLTDRISTSGDPHDVGAMADIYIGTVSTIDVRKTQAFGIINDSTYSMISDAIKSGASKVVTHGKDSHGVNHYLVVSDGIYAAPGTERFFAYTQKHIIGTLIPGLERARDRLDASNADSISSYNATIRGWQDLIKANEEKKITAMNTISSEVKKYSLAGVEYTHQEEGSSYYRKAVLKGPKTFSFNISGGTTKKPGTGTQDSKPSGEVNNNNADNKAASAKDRDRNEKYAKGGGYKGLGLSYSINLGGSNSADVSNAVRNYKTTIGGSGYSMNISDNSYIDVDVVNIEDDSLGTVNSTFMKSMNDYEKGGKYGYNFGAKYEYDDSKNEKRIPQLIEGSGALAHNYVFIQRGGATRNPWSDADSTFFYKPDGKRLPLGARSLRIDNPKIYVENPVVNNQPQDEAAVFTLHLSNDTEINDKTKYLNPSTLYLSVDETTNPDGAKLSIDGQPLRCGMPFYLNPGQSAVKTLEVRRGGKPLDYNNIKLQFTDNPDIWSVIDEATISVNYVPTSSPVNLSLPADNWLMNTLSQADEDGRYYIPVQIDGFSTTQYDNFDHIELQYKKQTESEDQWVCQCSFYADKELYSKATGQKAMITDPTKITNIRFYGEKDPVEMKYDLRAVAFCRLGTGYVTRASKVVSGTKDTRRPEVFGKPKPADGILDFDDVISLPFNEPIAYNYLDETVNFSVQGYTNSSEPDRSAYLYFPGTSKQKADGKVVRYCNAQDFSIEMMAKVEGVGQNGSKASLFRLVQDGTAGSPGYGVCDFGYIPSEDRLYVETGGKVCKSVTLASEGVSLTSMMQHVAVTHVAKDSTFRFYVIEKEIPLDASCETQSYSCKAAGYVSVGHNLKGQISDIRTWSKALSKHEIGIKYRKALSVNESGLAGYWPANEANGNVIHDVADGADLHLTGVTWQTPDGYSLRLDAKPVVMEGKAAEMFVIDATADYSLSFWFRQDGGAPANKDVVLFSSGNDQQAEVGQSKMRIGISGGKLFLRSEGETHDLGTDSISFSASLWHNLTLSVNHSFNTASVFLDGDAVGQLSGDEVGGISSSYIAFGDSTFCGNIDNITLWKMALPTSYIHSNYNSGLTGREAELLVNMNFEQTTTNSQGTIYTSFSPMNNVAGKDMNIAMVEEAAVTPDATFRAPVRSGTGLQNYKFSWTSNANELQINLDMAEAKINNQQVNIVVRNVEDLNGNVMKSSQMWTVYINRNVIEWDDDYVAIDLEYGHGKSVTAGFHNKSGRKISYSIEANTSWLSLDNVKGTMEPLSASSVALTIADGLAPGSYGTYIYLTDEDGLVSKLPITVDVVADLNIPEVADSTAYSNTMNIIAKVSKRTDSGNWMIDMSPGDVVVAFIDKVCLGRANVTIDPDAGSSKLYLTVHGNADLTNKPVEFALFSSSDLQIYNLVTGNMVDGVWTEHNVTYNNNKLVGGDIPLEMRTSQRKVQKSYLKKGWNWVSLNIRPYTSNGLNDFFLNYDAFTTGDLFTSVGHGVATFQSCGVWDTGFDDVLFTKDKVYQIYAQNPGYMSVQGYAIEEAERSITLKFSGTDWADLAYLLDVSQPIDIALSDFMPGTEKAPVGTIIKSHDQFAVAQKDGSWAGSLQYLRPGEGYYVKRNGIRDSICIRYTNNTISSVRERQDFAEFEGMDASGYSSSMPVIATFREGQYREGDVLLAVCGDRIVGYAEVSEDGRLFFLNVNAQDGSGIKFANLRGGTLVGITSKSVRYDATGVLGSLESPFVVDFTETGAESIYDLTGIKYSDIESLNARRGVFIINGKKKLK